MPLTTFGAETLHAFTREYEDLFYAAAAAAMTSYYAGDAQIMADGMRPVRGRTAITQFWRTAIDQATVAGARRAIELHEWSSSGDLGDALCTVTVELPGQAIAVSDATIWRRGPDGSCLIVVDISTPLPPG